MAAADDDEFDLATDKETVREEAPTFAERFPGAGNGANDAKLRVQAAAYKGPFETPEQEISALASTLDKAKKAAADAAEHPQLKEQTETTMKAVAEAVGVGNYKDADVAIKNLAEAAKAVKEENERLATRKRQLEEAYAKSNHQISAISSDASPEQIKRLTEWTSKIDANLGVATVSDPALNEAASGIGNLDLEIQAVQKEIGQEKQRLANERLQLLGSLENRTVPPGATGEEEEAIETLRTLVAEALPDPSKQSNIEGATKLVEALDTKIHEVSEAVQQRLLARKKELSEALKTLMNLPGGGTATQQGGTKAQDELLSEARKAVRKCLDKQALTEESLDEAERQLALLSSLTEQVQEEIAATFTKVEKKQRPVKTPEEREQDRQAAIRKKAQEVIDKAITVAGQYPLSTTPGRTDCVSHGPDIVIERNMAAEVKAIVVAKEGASVITNVGRLYIHIVPKGGNVYDLTLHKNYCRRYNPNVSPATQTILHVMVGGS